MTRDFQQCDICDQQRLRPACATRDFQQCGMCDQERLRPACAFMHSDLSLCKSLEYSMIMNIKLLTEHHLEFLSLNGGCTGLLESTLVQMPHCWKPRVTSHFMSYCLEGFFLGLVEPLYKTIGLDKLSF